MSKTDTNVCINVQTFVIKSCENMNIAARIVETDTETNAMEVRPMESIIRRILIYSPNNSGIHDPGYCDHAARQCTKDILTPSQCCSGSEKVLNCYKYLSRFNCNKSGCALSDKYGA